MPIHLEDHTQYSQWIKAAYTKATRLGIFELIDPIYKKWYLEVFLRYLLTSPPTLRKTLRAGKSRRYFDIQTAWCLYVGRYS